MEAQYQCSRESLCFVACVQFFQVFFTGFATDSQISYSHACSRVFMLNIGQLMNILNQREKQIHFNIYKDILASLVGSYVEVRIARMAIF